MRDAQFFACNLVKAWKKKTQRIRYYEVHLFRAFTDAIVSLSDQFHIEEYHGSKHQVAFGGHGTWAREIARCEMSDLLIVSFRVRPNFRARMTFLQAKRALETFDLCEYYPEFNIGTSVSFKANLEQWDLLSRRPVVIGVPPFDPPPQILKDAILSSVGSFGIFHKHSDGSIGFLYACADTLVPEGMPTNRYSRLRVMGGPSMRTINNLEELRLACCIQIFGQGLFDIQIGTPLDYDNVLSIEDRTYRDTLRIWLGGVMREHVRRSGGEAREVRTLLRFFEQSLEGKQINGPLPHLLLLRSDTDEEMNGEG